MWWTKTKTTLRDKHFNKTFFFFVFFVFAYFFLICFFRVYQCPPGVAPVSVGRPPSSRGSRVDRLEEAQALEDIEESLQLLVVLRTRARRSLLRTPYAYAYEDHVDDVYKDYLNIKYDSNM